MLSYILRRLTAFVPTLFAVSLLVFLMIFLIPGDPAATMLGPEGTPQQAAELRERLGLDRPFHEQMASWYGRALTGDLGTSYFLNQPVLTALWDRLFVTVSLSSIALVISSILGVTSGVLAAVRHRQLPDWGVMFLAMLGLSVPVFWLALNLIFLFSVKLGWLPTGGYVPLTEDPIQYLRHLVLPGLALGLVHTAVIARMSRSSMLEILQQDFVRTARAKGLNERRVIVAHAFRNSLIPVVTIIGISAGELLAGSVITETVFNLPGIGRLVVDAVKRRDYPLVQGGILMITLGYLFINLVVDVVYGLVNPKVRHL